MKLKNLKITKNAKIIILAALTLIAIDIYILQKVSQPKVVNQNDFAEFSETTLAKYDGTDPELPIYLALDGYVYDVTAGASEYYGPGQPYHDLVGKDSSVLLNMFGGAIVKKKYMIVGVYKP